MRLANPIPGPVEQANMEDCIGASGRSGISTAVRPTLIHSSNVGVDTNLLKMEREEEGQKSVS